MTHRGWVWVVPAIVLAGCGDDPDQLRDRAVSDWKAKRLDLAEDALARLAKVRPLDPKERLLRAQVARERGKIDEAIACLEGPAPPGSEADVAAALGTLELVRSRFASAEAALIRALELNPKRVDARRELINLYSLQGRAGDLEKAMAAAERAGLPLEFADVYLWTLGRREDIGPPDIAATLAQAVAADPGDRPSRLALAENLRRCGRLADAAAALGPLPATDPDARAARARIALDDGDDARAEALLNEPENTSAPPHPALARLRGRLALARGDAQAAVRHFRAATSGPGDPDRDVLAGLGQALAIAGDPAAAQPPAAQARERDRLEWLVQNARTPERRKDPAALRAIGDACAALKRRDVARAWYRLALAANPLDDSIQRAIFRLDLEAAPHP